MTEAHNTYLHTTTHIIVLQNSASGNNYRSSDKAVLTEKTIISIFSKVRLRNMDDMICGLQNRTGLGAEMMTSQKETKI